MNSYEKYYREKLYPFQDGILKLVIDLKTPFYLTGGTALSRYYLNHRYSDDLDIFVNNEKNYSKYVQLVYSAIEKSSKEHGFLIDYPKTKKEQYFTQIFLVFAENDYLKIDLINDVAEHFGSFRNDQILGKVDSWKNILSNKITALYRLEAKDIVDIWFIAHAFSFNWMDIFNQAKTKETGLDIINIFDIINSFPEELLDTVKWINPVDKKYFMKDLKLIAKDIFEGSANSLYSE